MTFNEHAVTFAGLPVVNAPVGEAVPSVDGPVAWRVAHWEYAEDDPAPGRGFLEAFEAFVSAAGSSVEALVIGAWGYAAFNAAPIEQLCAAAPRLPALRALYLGDMTVEECEVSWMKVGDVSPLLTAFPKLRVLRVRGGDDLAFQPVRHGALEELAVESGGLPVEFVRAVLASELPALTALELWLGTPDYGGSTTVADFEPLLQGSVLPGVRRLGLRNAEIADELAAALADAPVLRRLESLDLSLGVLGDAGAEPLLRSAAVSGLRRLDLHHHYLSETMVERLRAALVGVDLDVSEPQEGEDGQRYTALSE